ncbi:hypothetical protein L226DRAFT_398891 [Lentinus tigrinus ALCF2SS1-7]|uniref:Uncharacterized protein n=1 Tax=Lentinus tigrinus ALCF2SS1-6 TaxID=1328759 RepID=A0A5C2SD28_9APHY|nr:hypothetical protein L227DRAFT_54556 [Lentinus tigrinus ALCF2SS1-6]RPD76157.1 hypothetical protein L226DRAFT_398891 [Lentinus tigrinus ALCF2SS1-7]
MSQMPWNVLQTVTLRKVLSDLGLNDYTKSRRRSDLIKLMREISMDGLDTITQEFKDGTYAANYPRPAPRAPREASPEIEYAGPPPRSAVPVVEIPSARRHAQPQAGPSRARARARSEASVVPASPSPPAKKLKVSLPSYAVLYKQHQEIAMPSKEPFTLMNPHLKFDGVYIPTSRHHRRRRARTPPEPADDSEEEAAEEPVESASISTRRVNSGMEGATHGRARAANGVAGSSSSPRRMQPVVVVSHLESIVSPSARRAGPSRNAYSSDD